MTNLEVLLNEKLVCTAAIQSAAGAMSATIVCVKKEAGEEFFLHVTGHDANTQDQYRWASVDLRKGDHLRISLIDSATTHPPETITAPTIGEISVENKLRTFHRLKEELKDHLK